ncbi:MAG TPA: UvrD-helicase domain-containing protein [Solirubrobacteraceae bacterium]|nr:UvrD-helicase domain-containing protein [Solirubrobacteraceae bacterium]
MSGPDRTLLERDGVPLDADGRMLTPEQAAAVLQRDGPLMVAANAGSGKTTILVERFVRHVVDDGLDPGSILAITFTRRAAGELRRRVRARFMALGCVEHARAMEGAWISTIDGFCARVLRAHAALAGIDPEAVVLDESELRLAREEAWEAALAELLGAPPPALPHGEAELLVSAYTYDGLHELVDALHDELRSAGMTAPALPVPAAPDLAAPAAVLRGAAGRLEPALGTRPPRALCTAREAVARCRALLAAGPPAAPLGEDDLDAIACGGPAGVPELAGPEAQAYRAAHARLQAACRDARARPVLAALNHLLGAYGRAFAQAKRRRSGLDYADLTVGARDLLRSRPEIAAAYRERLQRVMVDEFQDTNALQLDLLDALGQEYEFAVGDRLQSIYAFRHADVGGFDRRWREREAQGGAHELAANFRSRPEILALINAAFGGAHAAFQPLAPGLEPAPAGEPPVEVLLTDADAWGALAEDDPRRLALEAGMPAAAPRVLAEARLVARRVARLIAEEGRAAREIVVLLRAGTNMPVYERAFELAAVPAVATQGRDWWTRREVQDLLNHLRLLVNPRDEEALLGALAAPFAGLRSDALAILAGERRRRDTGLWEIVGACAAGDREGLLAGLGDEEAGRLRRYHALVLEERRAAAWAGPAELLERAQRESGADLAALAGPGGLRRLANVRKLIRLADAFEARHGRDLRAFADHAAAELEAHEPTPDAPIDLGADEAVRIMTVHAAKGLEFPVVILADLGRPGQTASPTVLIGADDVGLRLRGIDGDSVPAFAYERLLGARRAAEEAEERRVMHVAMTRAKELLVLSGTFEPSKPWDPPKAGAPALSWMGPGLFGAAEPGAVGAILEVQRGPWRAQARVIIDAPAEAPAEAPQATSAPAPPPSAAPAPEPVPAEAAAAAPAVRAPRTLSYTSLAAYRRCPYAWYLRRSLRLPDRDDRDLAAVLPRGTGTAALERGSVTHAVLERADLRDGARPPDGASVRAVAASLGIALDDAAVREQVELAAAFLCGPLRARAARASDVRREAAFALPLDPGDLGGPLLDGVIDLLVLGETGGRALVVDYKTDRVGPDDDLEARVARDYAIQRAVYALAALRAGATAVDVVHLYLERPQKPVTATYAATDAPRLQAELAAAAAPLIAGEFPPTPEPHAALCATCPGRGGLCPHPDEATARPAPGAAADPQPSLF